jgi:hypothetical protein
MSTTVTVKSIHLSPAPPAEGPGNNNAGNGHEDNLMFGPTAFKINVSLTNGAATDLAVAGELDFNIMSKVPGGSGFAIEPPPPDITEYRLFKFTTKPKVKSATVIDNADGSKTVKLQLVVPSKVPDNTMGYSNEEQQTSRLLALTNQPIEVSETKDVTAMASTATVNGDFNLELEIPYPQPQPQPHH